MVSLESDSPCRTQFTLAPPGHAVTEYSSWHTGHAVTEYSSWHKHNAHTDSVSRVSALLRVSATVGLVCWTRGLGGPEYVLLRDFAQLLHLSTAVIAEL